MTFPSELKDELDAVLRNSPLAHSLGIELVSWIPGSATVQIATDKEHANLAGSVHGGILFTLADAAFEAACNSYGRVAVALETSCTYSRPAEIGVPLTAGASEVARSHRTASYKIDVRQPDGELIAWYMAVAYRTDRWHLGEDRWPEDWRKAH